MRCTPGAALAAFGRAPARSTAERGLVGEELAARAARRSGLRLIGRRVPTRAAEVDLVALDGEGALVVLEVKAGLGIEGGGARFRPRLHLRPSQLARLATAARALARAHGCAAWRVDLVEVSLRPSGAHITRLPLRRGGTG
ncbi:MAG: YraN family protein [Planctomycetota bacterium]